ncbi:DUF2752 domain-containing protein [Leptospira idonii]|uniref:DUF2752 domain-containing protein n=1 Tax=Leptospira idonii TaxID=1193500 RepID=A0A4V3JXX3_9LEPT|nr:DUF2752 domain-containing protein [Leptospira idonii]TGN18556.1 DUF2752 domain-containing protein [Leptospira idonii]
MNTKDLLHLQKKQLKSVSVRYFGQDTFLSGISKIHFVRFFYTVFFLVLAVVLARLIPLDTESEYWFSICWYKAITGLDCIACGLGRSILCLFRWDLSSSFSYHPFGPAIGFVIVMLSILRFHLPKKFHQLVYSRSFSYFVSASFFAMGIWFFFYKN